MPDIAYRPSADPFSRGDTVRRILRVWRANIGLFFACAITVLVVGGGAVELLKPTYTATATVAIPPQLADPLAPIGQGTASQADDDELPTTEASMMQSRDVAAAVLAQFPPPASKPGFSIRRALCRAGISFLCPVITPADETAKQQAEIDGFLVSLAVVPKLQSQVINVSVTANTGERAAMLADAVVQNYQRIDLARQTANLNGVATWLDTRTADLRRRWLDAVNTADAFSVSHDLTNAGGETTPDPLVDRQISDMAASLGAAQARLAAAQAQADALHDAAQHGDETAVVSLSEQPILVAAASNLMQLETTRNQLATEFGGNYPKIKALDSQIAAARATLNSQIGAALHSIGANLVSARAEVRQLTENLNTLRAQAAAQSSPQAEYRSLTQEAASARAVYETFLEHSNDVVDRAALLEPPVVFVSHANIPARPTFPNKPKLFLAVFVVALVAGAAATFIKDYFSVGFEKPEDLAGSVQLPLLAVVPYVAAQRNHPVARHVIDDPFSRTSEAVRGLAMKLSLLAASEGGSRSVLVASANPLEGKSTLAVWLAMTMRQAGKSVLVIDGDHRRGALMQNSSTASKLGMTDLLSGRVTASEVIQTDLETKIDFISAGKAMSGPVGVEEIARLRSAIGALKKSYNLIIIDSPPLLAMTDGLVHGSIADQAIFVCRWQLASRKAVSASLNRLQTFGARVSGVVVSMVDQNSPQAFGDDYNRREMKLISRLYGSQG
ncbi:MAG TPA: polysaccharide biosynthesis tyrosine autokinase [Acidocella sp.]|jgi:succinoglycan biosynthesis transport protein ExoP|uniref:GumC family protein n=1 Tax=Acidocella sp. TaxID=50710 RepID=UPI002B89272A|nr:polysaccharide biosynthesis tyrosine autokinase [Acidocella sp.]HVE21415.1 polysaccharide biosynthesis tyrosine autokinase [Acidocella sp.]